MRFTVTDEAAGRLGLPELKGRVFDAPKLSQSLAAYTNAERRWAKKTLLKIDLLQDVDVFDALALFYFLALRRVDVSLLPPERWLDLAPTDFELEPHEYDGELAQCGICGEAVRSPVHNVPEVQDRD